MTAPSVPTRCPQCFTELPAERRWTRKNPETKSPDETATRYAGQSVPMGEIVSAEPGDPAEWDEICPVCHYVLPPRWRGSFTACVAMAGARYTGKTVYIAVLIKQLERLGERFNQVVEPADATTRVAYRDLYEKPLYETRGIIAPTPSATTYRHHPLVFSLGIWNTHWGTVPVRLVIRDVAGEDLENPDNVSRQVLSFFSRAHAVFFLFDPLRVEQISHQLRELIPPPPGLGGDPREVLRTVMDLIGDGTPSLAVILSKFDAFQQLAQVKNSEWGRVMSNPGAAFNRDPGLVSPFYDNADGELVDAEVKSLLHRLDAGPQLRTMQNPITGAQYYHRFFAVSALGASPAGQKLHRNGISPFRCTDPVRWLLSGTGILEPPQR